MRILEDRIERHVVVQGDEQADSRFNEPVQDRLRLDGIGAGWEISSTRQLEHGRTLLVLQPSFQDQQQGYDWHEIVRAIDLVLDTFPRCRAGLAAEIAAEALDLDDGHPGKQLLLEKARELWGVGNEEDLRNEEWPKKAVVKLLRGAVLSAQTKDAAGHTFDHTFHRLWEMSLLGFNPAAICDVGASDGKWTRRCLQVFPRARYFCVDPLDENLASLTQLSAEHKNVSYWQGCLGPRSGTVTLNVQGDGSSILPDHSGNPYGMPSEVPLETLDNLIQQGFCPQPELLKLDVQGYELEVLKGAAKTLSEIQAIIAEVSFFSFKSGMPVFHEVVAELARCGFVVHDILQILLRPLDGATGQADLLFLRETEPLRGCTKWSRTSL